MKKTIAFVTLATLATAFAGCSAGGGSLIPASQQMQTQPAVVAGGPNRQDVIGGPPTRKDVIGGPPSFGPGKPTK